MPIIDHKNYLCIGCGGCAFKCPKQCITMSINSLGQYTPVVDRTACIECGLCEKICPLYDTAAPDREFKHNDIIGNYITCYMGYDETFRQTSASGGFVTGVLNFLLKNNIIDFAVCLRNIKTENSFYQYELIDNPHNLTPCSRSAYYPMEMSQMLKHIKENEGRYAIVVLPCQAKVIRTLQSKDSILRKRIVFLLGLVCGGVPGSAMVDYIALAENMIPNNISQISFREKNNYDLNRNYSVNIRFKDQQKVISNFFEGAFGFAFLNKLFHYKGCNICTDIFAEFADAVFMDAWLPEFRNEKLGRSICVIRSRELFNIISKYFLGNSNCKEVEVDVPIKAQNSVGLVQRKKKQAYYKSNLYKRLGYITPDYGTHHFSITENIKFFIRSMQEYFIQHKAQSYWNKYRTGEMSFSKFNFKIHRFVKLIKRI